MGSSRGINAKGRRESGAFIALPCAVLDHPNFIRLTPKSVKLLMDMLAQIRLKRGGPVNNGDLAIAWSMMEPRNWKSKRSLYEARDELIHYGFIMITRQGGKHGSISPPPHQIGLPLGPSRPSPR